MLQKILVEQTVEAKAMSAEKGGKLNLPWRDNQEMLDCLGNPTTYKLLMQFAAGKGFGSTAVSNFRMGCMEEKWSYGIIPLK